MYIISDWACVFEGWLSQNSVIIQVMVIFTHLCYVLLCCFFKFHVATNMLVYKLFIFE